MSVILPLQERDQHEQCYTQGRRRVMNQITPVMVHSSVLKAAAIKKSISLSHGGGRFSNAVVSELESSAQTAQLTLA